MTPTTLTGLTIVLPCYDEADNLPAVVRAATAAAERCAAQHEIVLVDDGSTDETLAVAGRLAAADRRLRLLVHSGNRGYAEALRTGIAVADQPWVLLVDADLQFDLDELDDFVSLTPSADLIVGWRVLRRGSPTHRFATALWNRFVLRMFSLPVRDVDCAFRLVRRDLLQRLDLRAVGPLFGPELLVKGRAAGARIAEVPVHHRDRVAGRQAGPGPRLSARTLRELLALRRAPLGV